MRGWSDAQFDRVAIAGMNGAGPSELGERGEKNWGKREREKSASIVACKAMQPSATRPTHGVARLCRFCGPPRRIGTAQRKSEVAAATASKEIENNEIQENWTRLRRCLRRPGRVGSAAWSTICRNVPPLPNRIERDGGGGEGGCVRKAFHSGV